MKKTRTAIIRPAKINFGKVSRFFLIGGGPILFDAARYLNAKKYDVTVISSKRHYSAQIRSGDEKSSLADALLSINVKSYLLDKFDIEHEAFKGFNSNSIVFTPSSEWIFSQEIINRFDGRIVNIHGSALPEMRGGGGLSWNLMMRERNAGSTIHLVDAGIDTGDILFQQTYTIPDSVSSLEDATEYAYQQNSQLTHSFFKKVESQETFNRIPQSEEKGSYWPRLKTDVHGFIDWTWNASDINSFICAFGSPFKGASTFIAEKRVRILHSEGILAERNFHPFQYGLVFRGGEEKVYVACKGGALAIREILDDTGHRINLCKIIGRRLHTPILYLEAALRQRVVFAPVSDYDEFRINL
jgi:methionyl-tRNA formyltransferase